MLTTPWTPSYTPNGWWPKLNYPWVAHGSGQCWVTNIDTGETLQCHPERRCQPAGWLSSVELCYYVDELPADIYAYDVIARAEHLLNRGRYINRVVARGGRWATGLAAGGVVTYNGLELARGVGWRVDVDGPVLACQANDGLHIWLNGEARPTVTPQTTLVDPNVRGLRIGYGYNSPARVYNLAADADLDMSVAPWGKESAPIDIHGWIWTTTEKPDGTAAALGRPAGDDTCLVLECASAVGLDVQLVGEHWVVATFGSQGQLVVQAVRVDAPRARLEPLPPVDDPVVAPFGRPVHVGYFFRDTYQYGKNPSAPGNVSIVVDEPRAALTADPCVEDNLPIDLIVGPSGIETGAESPEYWNRVKAIYLAAEMAGDLAVQKIRDKRDMCRWMFAALHLAPKPFLVYTGAIPRPVLADGGTWIGVQLYLTGTQGPDDLRVLADSLLRPLAGVPVALIAHSYDRRSGLGPESATYTGDLAALQPVYADLVRQWPNVKVLAWFSDGRRGGARDHPEVYPWHRAIARAARRA